jgi:hypothetical protein
MSHSFTVDWDATLTYTQATTGGVKKPHRLRPIVTLREIRRYQKSTTF